MKTYIITLIAVGTVAVLAWGAYKVWLLLAMAG